MRLIDADALKKDVEKYLELNQETMLYDDDVINMIDYAPTVEAIPNKEGYEMYNKGYVKGKEERPTGEWIFDSDYTVFGNPYGTYRCNKCGGHSSNKYPFCFWCGARMKGEENND